MQPNSITEMPQSTTGVVELREDVPLKSSSSSYAGGHCCTSGPRFIVACFAVLTIAITIALITQIFSGDYQVVPHGSVSSSAAACSRAGTDVLKAGGRVVDAAVAAALCLAIVAPHRTSLDASGSLLYWEYRKSRTQLPTLVEWGASGGLDDANKTGPRPPRLVTALASLHARLGVLPWSQLLQPALLLARDGFRVSEGWAQGAATGPQPTPLPGTVRTAPQLAIYFKSLQGNTSAELTAAWANTTTVRTSEAHPTIAGGWRFFTNKRSGAVAADALAAALKAPLPLDPDTTFQRVVRAMQAAALRAPDTWPKAGPATGLAVVDQHDTYLALVTGLSTPFGSGPMTTAGWIRDEPLEQLDLAPALLIDQNVCGTRYVIGADSSAALGQAAAALITIGAAGAVEWPRVEIRERGLLAAELRPTTTGLLPLTPLPSLNATPPYAAVNIVQQRADALMSHADSRGGGLASRF